MIAREGRVAPHTDPELKRKLQSYARLVRDMCLRGLVSFGAPSEATVGVLVVPKKQRKQRRIFDTRRVKQPTRSAAMTRCVACVLGWATAPVRLGTPHGADRCEHRVLPHPCAERNV